MTEFDVTQWSDFVRGVADPETAGRMRDRLEAGPAAARRTVEALRCVAAVGRSDGESPVPPSAVRIAKAIGGTSRTGAVSRVRRLRCMTAFDSLLEPAAAGMRGLQESHRELTFEAQGYSIDLRLEHEIEPPNEGLLGAPPARRVIVGQLLKLGDDGEPAERSRPGGGQGDDAPRPVARAPVFMFSGERLIGKAMTGRHGEFQVEGPPRESLDLCVLAGEDYLEMPLPAEPTGTESPEDAP